MKSIIAGQFVDVDSPVHRLDPRAKVFLLFCFIAFLILTPNFATHISALLILFLTTILAKIPKNFVVKFLYGSRFFFLMALLVNLLFTPGEGGFDWLFLHISLNGARNGLLFGIRIYALIWSAGLFGWTTSPVAMADSFESLAKPLSRIGVPTRDIAMMLLLAMRFLPTLLADANELKLAQMSRGARFNAGNPIQRTKALIPLIVPLFIGAFRRADESAIALQVRGYSSEGERTSLYPPKFRKVDVFAILMGFIFVLLAVFFRF